MRRFVLVFLMMLLPLQSVWSAAASVCAHESEVTVRHFGHHKAHHDEASRDDTSGDSQPLAADADHDHLPGANPVPSMPSLAAPVVADGTVRPHEVDRYSSLSIAGLERPPRKLAEIPSARSARLHVTLLQ